MEWWSDVPMVFFAEFIPASLLILQIIQRSTTILLSCAFFLVLYLCTYRVLLATIRDFGLCPCPRCLTPKSKLHLMGQARDAAYRLGAGIRYYLLHSVL